MDWSWAPSGCAHGLPGHPPPAGAALPPLLFNTSPAGGCSPQAHQGVLRSTTPEESKSELVSLKASHAPGGRFPRKQHVPRGADREQGGQSQCQTPRDRGQARRCPPAPAVPAGRSLNCDAPGDIHASSPLLSTVLQLRRNAEADEM